MEIVDANCCNPLCRKPIKPGVKSYCPCLAGVRYCSRECTKADRKRHEPSCSWKPSIRSSTMLFTNKSDTRPEPDTLIILEDAQEWVMLGAPGVGLSLQSMLARYASNSLV